MRLDLYIGWMILIVDNESEQKHFSNFRPLSNVSN